MYEAMYITPKNFETLMKKIPFLTQDLLAATAGSYIVLSWRRFYIMPGFSLDFPGTDDIPPTDNNWHQVYMSI